MITFSGHTSVNSTNKFSLAFVIFLHVVCYEEVWLYVIGSPVEDLLVSLQKPGILFDIAAADGGEVSCVAWTTEAQLAVLKAYPEVLMMDGTYKVRKCSHNSILANGFQLHDN